MNSEAHGGMENMKIKLSMLWLFVTLNYIYADILTLMDSSVLNKLLTGQVDGMQITDDFLLIGAILMEIPIAMVVLSRLLAYRTNRWANIVAGVIKTAAVAGSLTVGEPALYYSFFAAIEIACTAYIVWLAWNWRQPEPEAQ
ncbi:MAG: DUF6326 family protein [Nitrospinota bacterium]|nr:DUF6326 family protein [Nitrospinota bacterium]